MISSADHRVDMAGALAGAEAATNSVLPVQLTRFVGRRAELAQVCGLLESTRLLTLTGPGGSGKTRLAVEVARALEQQAGVALWWVELAGLNETAQVAHQVAAALRLVEEAGRPPARALSESIGARPAVVVLDNCEHVVDACAQLSDELLRSCPNLRILATSREGLGVPGETAWLVPPLSLPHGAAPYEEDALAGSEAIALFIDRARAVAPGFTLSALNAEAVAGICRRLDGIPLAIELAAARVKILTPWQILERLDDCFALLVQRGRRTLPRHQTMRAAIDWSYHLLLPQKQLLLQRLSVFAGGFTLEAAEEVCAGGDIDSSDVLDLVAGLVERSLVIMSEDGDSARYRLLEVVRQYAAECLGADASDASVLARRHANFFADFADAAGPAVDIHQDVGVMARVAAEHDNLRSALDWALRSGEAALALRISGGLWPWWLHGMHWSDGLASMTKVLDQTGVEAADPAQSRALIGAGVLAYAMQDLARAQAWMEAAERVCTQWPDARHLALVHQNLAQLAIHHGDQNAALAHAESSVRFAHDSGDEQVLSFVLATGPGFVHAFRGEADRADACCAEAQRLAHLRDYAFGLLVASFSRAMTALMSDDVESAARHAVPAVSAMRRVDNPWFMPRLLLVCAAVAVHHGELERAARLLAACQALQASARGGRLLRVEQPYFEHVLTAVRGTLAADPYASAWQDGGALGPENALAEAEAALVAAAPRSVDGRAAPRATRPGLTGEKPGRGGRTASAEAVRTEPQPEARLGGLRVRALGPLEIYRGDELLGAERWSYAKPRELLLYLLCHPIGATKEQIGAAIWPDGTPSQVRNNLHVTLHYVRRALGSNDWIVFADDRYLLDRTRTVSFDFDAFEEVACRIIADPDAADDAALDAALTLYRGDFLGAESFGAWHFDWRDRALSRYVELLSIRADRCFQRGDYADALRLYRILVAREELREDLHRRLMQCLARTGERVRALRHGEHVVALLQEALGAEPEPDTAELCERLRRAEMV